MRAIFEALFYDREPEGKIRFENGRSDRLEKARAANEKAAQELAETVRSCPDIKDRLRA